MSPRKAGNRRGLAASIAVFLAFVTLGGCAAGENPMGRDGSIDASSMDAGDLSDGGEGTPDAGPPVDAGPPDAGPPDAGPMIERGTCESCEDHDECAPGAFCVALSVGGRACVPGCNPDIPTCPRSFSCVLDVLSGVDSTVCLPVGGACCVDEDADDYGQGVGCMGADCDDADEAINPGASEICNGIDDNCDGADDGPPTDCLSGRCSATGDGSYEAVEGATCVLAECSAGTTTPCGLFTCEDGGESGNRCATACAPTGTDDDTLCIEGAHCDTGACVMDEPNGGMCDEDSDCTAAHCDNGFCCGIGTCCSTGSDCPGGGGIARICETPSTCQGSRGETTCEESQCRTVDGIDDDTACDTSTRARDCGLYDPINCTGAENQPSPVCPTSCTGDTDCVDLAHCEVGFCVPDRPAAGSCSRPQDCQDGLFCVDGVCCNSACTGTCQACNLPLTAGMCASVPAMADPAGECPGFSCAGYFSGFGAGEDACYQRQDVGDAAASCNGAGACISAATACSLQPRGATQIDCNNSCESPVSGTCTGTTPGACLDLDDPSDTTSCGTGECRRSVQRCVGGIPQTCTPGPMASETCNLLDDDCDGTPDDGPGASLCPAAPQADLYTCSAGTCSFTCNTGRVDLNGTYADGCECTNPSHGTSCATLTTLPAVGASNTVNGFIATGEVDWFSVSFPSTGRGPAQGNPQIRLTGTSASNFELAFYRTCAANFACGTGSASGVGSFSFLDNQSTAGANQWSGPHSTAWPTTVIFSVQRVASVTTCAAASYTIALSR